MTQPQSQKKLTEELLAELLDAPSIDGYVSGHDFPATTLSAYLQQLLDEKGLARSRVVRMADLNETFGTRSSPARATPRATRCSR